MEHSHYFLKSIHGVRTACCNLLYVYKLIRGTKYLEELPTTLVFN
jgi:hypothetical protein